MTPERVAILLAGPFCLVLAIVSAALSGLDHFDAVRIAVLGGVGGWIIGRWR